MAKKNIKWKVADRPTGFYRSFERRGWPIGYSNDGSDNIIFLIKCEDEYDPKKVKAGNHGLLKLQMMVTADNDPQRVCKWVTFKKEWSGIDEIKDFAERAVEQYRDKIYAFNKKEN